MSIWAVIGISALVAVISGFAGFVFGACCRMAKEVDFDK